MERYPSPLRYPGGKVRLAPFLLKLILKNFSATDEVTMVEPYAGGAGASLALLIAGRVKRIVINDLDRAIYAFWRVATTDTDYLIKKIYRTPIDMVEWHKQRATYLNPNSTRRQLAFAALFLNRTNRSGILGGRPIGGLEQNSDWDITARFRKRTIAARLRKIGKLRDRIIVSNLDGVSLLHSIQDEGTSSKYFIFIDPPYYEKGSSLYLNHYHSEDHEALAAFLSDSSLTWIMTYDDADFIRRLYSGFYKRRFAIPHSAQIHKTGREVAVYSRSLGRVYP